MSGRTFHSVRNSAVAMVVFVFNLALQFISRKVFLDSLGNEVLGLNTTATSILQFLNLAELGVGTAVTFALYRPLNHKDYETINEIMTLQGWLYRRIAFVVIAGSLPVMAFFPLIFSKMQLPLWYAYASFSVLLFSSLFSYFVNYKEILLTASQQEYKIHCSYRMAMLVKIGFQIFFLKCMDNGYVWWLILEVCFSIIASVVLNFTIHRSFPYLRKCQMAGAELVKKYTDITVRIKQFFFHKIAGFVLFQLGSVIIYAFTSLTMVAIYGNYMIIVNGIWGFLNAIFNGMAASVGDLVAEGDAKRNVRVMRELFTSRFLVVGILTFSIFMLANPFVALWVGEEYVLDKWALLLIAITFFLNNIRSVVESYIVAYGLFKDIWAPIAEAILNIGCSVLLGYFWGLHGILLGVICSLIVIVFIWKPYFLFTEAIKAPCSMYYMMFLKHLVSFVGVSVATIWMFNIWGTQDVSSFPKLILYSIELVSVFTVLMFSIQYVIEQGMRDFIKRFIRRSR